MWGQKIIGLMCGGVIGSVALVGPVPVGQAQVQGLDDLSRPRGGSPGCPGGYVEGLGCSNQRPVGPGIQDSDQGWQRDWQEFGAGDPGLAIIYGNENGPYPEGGPHLRPPGFGPLRR